MPPDRDVLQELRQLYRDVFTSPRGHELLEHWRKKYGDAESYVVGDTHQTAYKEGQRSVYRAIQTMLRPTEG
jgi:hypothetical protein